MASKTIKGSLIRVTDADLSPGVDLQLVIDPTRAKTSNLEDTYIELDVTTAQSYTLLLPSIESLGGFLNATIYVTDIKGTIDPTNKLTIKVEPSSDDTIGGQEEVVVVGRFSGMFITPMSSKQWGTFYTQNFSSKLAAVAVDEEIPLFRPKVP